LLVDGHPYDNRYDDRCRDLQWYSDDDIDYVSAAHHAYREAPTPPDACHRAYVAASNLVVRRTIVFVKDPGYLVVLDSVRPRQGKVFARAISGWWHGAAAFHPTGEQRVVTGDQVGAELQWLHADGLQRLEPGWDFDESVECAPRSSYSLRARRWFSQTHTGINGFTTVIRPFADGAPPEPLAIAPLRLRGGERYRTDGLSVAGQQRTDRILLNPEHLPDVLYRGTPLTHAAVIRLGRKRIEVR
jgi:hypothetical protein